MPSIYVHDNYVCLSYFDRIYVCLTRLHGSNGYLNNLERFKFTNTTVNLMMRSII